MTNEELLTSIRAAGFVPVQIRNEEGDEKSRTFFEGTFEQFLKTAKEIESKVILVEATVFDDWLFIYNPAENNEDDPDAPDEDIELVTVSPSLAKYKKYINQHYTFFLSTKGGAADLDYILDQEWVEQFETDLASAQEKADIQIISRKIKKDKGLRN